MKLVTRAYDRPTTALELPTTEVHIWVAPLPEDDPPGEYRRALTPEEMERALRYRHERIRNQFIRCRGMLRVLLGQYLGCEAAAVPIRYEAAGKPMLPPGLPCFNVSHSEHIAALAFAHTRIGVDIEHRRPMPNMDSLVERFFSPAEGQAYLGLPEPLRERAFFRMWTRKEALLKAVGQGIHALDRCEISVHPDQAPCVLKLLDEPSPGERWHLRDWSPAEGYDAALALEVGV
jgi:4'-phosphopantetheinyl transferase